MFEELEKLNLENVYWNRSGSHEIHGESISSAEEKPE